MRLGDFLKRYSTQQTQILFEDDNKKDKGKGRN